ncbi:hypothetical protein V3N99_19785 [Dermatophilaceae bacterium Soc4.6]
MTDQSGKTVTETQESRMTGESTPGGDKDSLGPAETTTAVSEPVASADRSRETEEETRDSGDSGDSGDSEEAKRASAEEFGRQHDPAKHDIAAGEESRQRGDWTADEPDGRVWDAEGNLVEATSIGQPADGEEESGDHGAAALDRAGEGRRTSSLDEVRDGGYSVGSAAPIDDGAMPLGHAVKAWESTKTFIVPGDSGYDQGDPDLWFTDPGAAGRAGFEPAP